ncbi:Nonribosomal peptide syntethase 9 [Bienertia sinuspersici]
MFVTLLVPLQVAIDSATPVDDVGPIGGLLMDTPEPPYSGYGPMRGGYGRIGGGSYGFSSSRPSIADWRYRPY